MEVKKPQDKKWSGCRSDWNRSKPFALGNSCVDFIGGRLWRSGRRCDSHQRITYYACSNGCNVRSKIDPIDGAFRRRLMDFDRVRALRVLFLVASTRGINRLCRHADFYWIVDLAKVCGINAVPRDARAPFWHISLLAWEKVVVRGVARILSPAPIDLLCYGPTVK